MRRAVLLLAVAGSPTALCSAAMAAEPVFEARMDETHVLVRIAWADDRSATLGAASDGRPLGDNSEIEFDFDGNGVLDGGRDGTATVNPWPAYGGLWWQGQISWDTRTKITRIGGRGAVRHDPSRVDTYLIPRSALAGLGPSTKVKFRLDSPSDGARYVSGSLPFAPESVDAIDVGSVPDDFREQTRAAPTIGQRLDPWRGEWIGEEPTSYPVLLAFWATWCMPCVGAIPDLEHLASSGQAVVGINEQSLAHVRAFQRHNPMGYPVLAGSPTPAEYGLTGLPHYLLVGRDRTVLWVGTHVDADAIGAAARSVP